MTKKIDNIELLNDIITGLDDISYFDLVAIQDSFAPLFKYVCSKYESFSEEDQVKSIRFIAFCYSQFEIDFVRIECLKLASISILENLVESKRMNIIKKNGFSKAWKTYEKKKSKQEVASEYERTFLYNLALQFRTLIEKDPKFTLIEKLLELFIDLLSQYSTRRFVYFVVEDTLLIPFLGTALSLIKDPRFSLTKQLFVMLKFYYGMDIDLSTGLTLSDSEKIDLNSKNILEFQKVWFSLKIGNSELHLLNTKSIKQNLAAELKELKDEEFYNLCEHLDISSKIKGKPQARSLLEGALVFKYEERTSLSEIVDKTSLYPDEVSLFDDSITKHEHFNGSATLPIPKLGLQYLSMNDYLLRNFHLFRLESMFEIRQDVEKAVQTVQPTLTVTGHTEFAGWSRMALPIHTINVSEIGKPLLGESKPLYVKAQVSFSIARYSDIIKKEWDALKTHDVLFLVYIDAARHSNQPYERGTSFREHFGIKAVRGCEVYETADEEEGELRKTTDFNRTLSVKLDSSQFQNDNIELYSKFNLIVRRKPKENNFKGVLETIRELMKIRSLELPEYLNDFLLGVSEPVVPQIQGKYLMADTFMNDEHLKNSLHLKVKVEGQGEETNIEIKENEILAEKVQVVDKHKKKNQIPFTKKQMQAILSGMSNGLTMIVGPPGSGKTDVTVQIISNLYHAFPHERIIIVTHSNQALNQIFEKMLDLDIEERHLLRLGQGAEELKLDSKYTKYGRLEWLQSRKTFLLGKVEELAKELMVPGDHHYTLETAIYFYSYHVLPLWNEFIKKCNTNDYLISNFPFRGIEFSTSVPFETNLQNATVFFHYIEKMFQEITDLRPLEILKTSRMMFSMNLCLDYDRHLYLVMKEAKIIAMTSTYAALKWKDFSIGEIKFKFNTLVMEECSQISEIEAFIPMVLQQNPLNLKRVILVGDHQQLPPIIKNRGLAKYGNMEQSMFYRFIRLGYPYIQLDSQGRSRKTIADLFRWKYEDLKDLPVVETMKTANPGFRYEFQFINVDDYQGRGETQPVSYFYQNLGEAEYVVAVYQYMRLLGYPANKISILTMYNGQKQLIKDVLSQRCAWNSYFGYPHKVTTVDQYQGQQNEYILLSLVRTRDFGHTKDLRRWIVAMSRARYGLYVFGRWELFSQLEMTSYFKDRSNQLELYTNEKFGEIERSVKDNKRSADIVVSDLALLGSFVYEEIKKFENVDEEMD